MAVDVGALRREVGSEVAGDDEDFERHLSVAGVKLQEYCGAAITLIPGDVLDQAHLSIAVELFNQRNAPNGVLNTQFETSDGRFGGSVVRVSRDPLRLVRPMLSDWVPTVFAL